MRRLKPETEKKLYWFISPVIIVGILVVLDTELEWGLKAMEWYKPALLGCLLLAVGAYCVAAIREKCWGLFIFVLAITIFAILNIYNFFIPQPWYE